MSEQSSDEKKLLWNYYSKHGLFRREEYYGGLLFIICASMVFYCKSDFYLFGLNHILAIGNVLSHVYLGMSTIMNGHYDIKTKEFYSLFYLFVPVYLLIGIVAAFFISPHRYEILIVRIKKIKSLFLFFYFLLLSILPIVAPMIGFNNPTWLTIFNTMMMSAVIYGVGRLAIASITKFNLRG